MQSVFQKAMGSDFSKLSTELINFHGVDVQSDKCGIKPMAESATIRYQGIFSAYSSKGVLSWLVSKILGLSYQPVHNKQFEFVCEITEREGVLYEKWLRFFNKKPMSSLLSSDGHFLIEKLGLFTIKFRMKVDDNERVVSEHEQDQHDCCLIFNPAGVYFQGIKLPPCIHPIIEANEYTRIKDPDIVGFKIDVTIPILGFKVYAGYSGFIKLN